MSWDGIVVGAELARNPAGPVSQAATGAAGRAVRGRTPGPGDAGWGDVR